jgi:hypothetical protein
MTFPRKRWYSIFSPTELGGRNPHVTCCFAIIPDGVDLPVAVFENLEDAMEWGVRKYGGGRFTIRHMPLQQSVAMQAKKAAAS